MSENCKNGNLEDDVDFYENEDAELQAIIQHDLEVMRNRGYEVVGNVVYMTDEPEEDGWDEVDYDYFCEEEDWEGTGDSPEFVDNNDDYYEEEDLPGFDVSFLF